MNFINLGINRKYIELLNGEQKVRYIHQNKEYKFTDPEEKVRASYYIELIEKYNYKPERISFEVVVPRRTPSDLADIVVYEDDEKKIPYIAIECKKENISDNEFIQAIEQSFGNSNSISAKFSAIISGNTRRFFDVANFPSIEREKNIIADIPINYGKIQEFRYKKEDINWDLKPLEKFELINVLNKCKDTLWDGGKLVPTDAFDELSKILFVKIRDEKLPRKKGEPYDFQIKTYETVNSVYNRITNLYNEAKKKDPDVFTDSIKIEPAKLFTVVTHLQGLNFNKTDLDTKGVAFEMFMEDFFKGKHGQYFTPREIVKFIVNLFDIKNDEKVLDPACGSGGFLLNSLEKMRLNADDYYTKGTGEHFNYWHSFATNNLFGIEISDKIARIAKMNMIIHDDGHTNVVGKDALDNINSINNINQGFKKDTFDYIITNPPFGSNINLKEKPYLKDFFFGKNKQEKNRKSQKTEILFIERCWEFLKYGTGKLGIILPDGILNNTTLKYVRDFILEKFEVEAIFSLPQITFIHYGAGVKSSILILRKRNKDEKMENNNVFCGIIENVGYDATGRTHNVKNDLEIITEKYFNYKSGRLFNEHNCFIEKINNFNNNRLDCDYYSPKYKEILQDIKKYKYPLRPLNTVCISIETGKTPAKVEYSDNICDTKIVKVANLKKGKVLLDNLETTLPEFNSNFIIENGDILLLCAAHQSSYLGKNPCIVENVTEEKLNFVGELINIKVNKEIISPYYLLQLLNTKNFYMLINREKRGQTSHLYPKDLKKIKIPVPENIEIQNTNAEIYIKNYEKYEDYVKKAEDILKETYKNFEDEFLK